MALFFDSAWFDARLEASGLRRADVAAALGLTAEQIAELWKDQRELMIVTFAEKAEASSDASRTRRQYWMKEDGGWRIFYERLLG